MAGCKITVCAMLVAMGALLTGIAVDQASATLGNCLRNATPGTGGLPYPTSFGSCGSGPMDSNPSTGQAVCSWFQPNNADPFDSALIINGVVKGPWRGSASVCPSPNLPGSWVQGRVRNLYPVAGATGNYFYQW